MYALSTRITGLRTEMLKAYTNIYLKMTWHIKSLVDILSDFSILNEMNKIYSFYNLSIDKIVIIFMGRW